MDLSWKGFLQRFEEGLDEVPLGAPHVDDDGEATFAHVLTVGRSEVRHDQSWYLRLQSTLSKWTTKPEFPLTWTIFEGSCQVSYCLLV